MLNFVKQKRKGEREKDRERRKEKRKARGRRTFFRFPDELFACRAKILRVLS